MDKVNIKWLLFSLAYLLTDSCRL